MLPRKTEKFAKSARKKRANKKLEKKSQFPEIIQNVEPGTIVSAQFEEESYFTQSGNGAITLCYNQKTDIEDELQ